MNDQQILGVDVYIGAPIEHESERTTLQEVERLLLEHGYRAVVFANFEVASRQIDLLVALDDLALVIEAKHMRRPVRGGENGPWKLHLATGAWKEFRNPYRQALNAALVVKDAMGAFSGGNAPYVDAALVFAPDIPDGSQAFSGNAKVSVSGHDGLRKLLGKRSRNGCSLNRWKSLAQHLKLTRALSVSAACDPRLAEAESRIRQYTSMFLQTYENDTDLVPFPCRSNGEALTSAEVAKFAFERRGGLLLQGPSGCGKSMLAASAGVAFSERGGVVVGIHVKEFDGSLKEVLDRDVGLLGARSATGLLRDARLLGLPILFIVDGYNECAEDLQRLLTRAIVALAYRYEAGILLTSQIPLVRSDLLDLRKIDVPTPTLETKLAIVDRASGGMGRPENVECLVAAVSTGLEARLLGEVGAMSLGGSSRYALFDAFARERFGKTASDCIGALADVAAWLFERVAFSMSVRDFDRLMYAKGVSPGTGRMLLGKALLTLRGDRVSFAHEMFFDAFAAEAVVRQAADQPDSILKALAAPLHAARKALVIGAIDDDTVLERLLPRLEDYGSIKACLIGRCGSQAQEWAHEHCSRLWITLEKEARDARFRIGGGGAGNVEFDDACLAQPTCGNRAFFRVLAELILEGRYVEQAFDVIGVLDSRIAEEVHRLCDETGTSKLKLRTELFAIGYIFPQQSQSAPGISTICAALHSGVAMVRDGCESRMALIAGASFIEFRQRWR